MLQAPLYFMELARSQIVTIFWLQTTLLFWLESHRHLGTIIQHCKADHRLTAMTCLWFSEDIEMKPSIGKTRAMPTLWAAEEGANLAELAIVLPLLILMLVVLIDLGRAYYYAVSLTSAAHAAAVYGTQNPTDTNGIVSAASANAPDLPSISTSVSYGCECYDGSSVISNCSTQPACSDNYVNFVAVTTSATYTPIIPYPGFPKSFALTGSAWLRSGGD
jgi:hypothetical protein